MEVISFNTNKQKVAIIDSYKSFIWNDRYEDLGDFELYIPANAIQLLANIHQDYYIQCSESDRTMIVERVHYMDDLDDGKFVAISGRSLESILERRTVWNDDGSITQVNLTKILDPKSKNQDSGMSFPVWMAIEYLLKLYVIDPEACGNKPQRKIPDVVFVAPDVDDPIYSIQMQPCSYQGTNLYDTIKSLSETFEFSFKMVLNPEDGKLYFSLYKGVSHLASQTKNNYVCFSPDFDNLLSSDSSIDMATYRNMAYYKGRGLRYVVKEYSDKEITMQTGYVRIKDNKVWAVNTNYGQNDSDTILPKIDNKNMLDWAPEEFNADYDDTVDPPTYPTYNKDDLVSRTIYGGALMTEDKAYFLATEPEVVPGSEEEFQSILLYSGKYDIEVAYYRCKQNNTTGDWDPTKWERVDIRCPWGDPAEFYSDYVPGTSEEPAEHKEGDVVKYDSGYYSCIEEHKTSGSFDSTKWVPVIMYDILHQNFYDTSKGEAAKDRKVRSLWSECENWIQGKQYKTGDFVTFNDSSRTGKITIYRKTADDAVYNSKNTYDKNAVVWYNTTNTSKHMYVRKDYQNSKKGVAPTNSKYWTEIKDKFKEFNAQQWEALDDIGTEEYDIFGSVQDNVAGGMDRRETFVDATAVPSSYNYFYNDKSQDTIDWLVDEGVMKATVKDMALAELTIPTNRMTKKFDAEIAYSMNFKYGIDYNIGDVVEVHDAYGYYDSVRVKDFIISDDSTGFKCYPTFESVEASTITTRLLEVNDELLGNTFLVKIPESSRFAAATTIATAEKDDTTYYLKSFVKRVSTDSDVEKGKKVRRDLHMVAWVTTDDIYTNYEDQDEKEILKQHPTVIGEPLFYIDVDADTNMKIPGVLFPSWAPPYGTDLGIIKTINTDASQYKNILLANI